ncbi:MAG: hypothetical protein FD145_935 [Candidatus Saganbacteria bacterium]|uniref:Uncharacterized protein n=1 Tax=Candidatus Saganbacteria bacterium TaxID=2575572 RepID=A0A833NZW0_UNCSA|nr:MAG: hypothetical protein FD145_935 [Candidatus Saganbacteria bacterium]
MITEKDIIKMKTIFATKADLEKFATKKDLESFGLKIDGRFHEIDRKFDKIDVRFDKITTMLDKVMGELEKAREDRIFAKAKDDEQDQKICIIESRVGKIEEKMSV